MMGDAECGSSVWMIQLFLQLCIIAYLERFEVILNVLHLSVSSRHDKKWRGRDRSRVVPNNGIGNDKSLNHIHAVDIENKNSVSSFFNALINLIARNSKLYLV